MAKYQVIKIKNSSANGLALSLKITPHVLIFRHKTSTLALLFLILIASTLPLAKYFKRA